MKTRKTLGLGTIAAALLLTACTPPSSSATPGGSGPAPAPGVTVTTTVTVTPAPSAAPATPDYDFTHFHGAAIGMTWPQMGTALHTVVGGYTYPNACDWYGPLWTTEYIYTHAFTDARSPSGAGATFFYTQSSVDPATAPYPGPRNAEGVGVGSTKDQVIAAYPGAVVGSFDDLGAGHIVTITVNDPAGSGSKYVFGIDGSWGDGSNVIDLVQWGPGAGTQWSHLCTGF